LLVKDSLEFRDEVSASLKMRGRNIFDTDWVAPLIPKEHVSEEIHLFEF